MAEKPEAFQALDEIVGMNHGVVDSGEHVRIVLHLHAQVAGDVAQIDQGEVQGLKVGIHVEERGVGLGERCAGLGHRGVEALVDVGGEKPLAEGRQGS